MPDESKKRRVPAKEYADREYVDQSVDANRQYSETLFSKAESRVQKVLETMIDTKLKVALETIRPKFDASGEEWKRGPVAETLGSTKMPYIAPRNEECVKELSRKMALLAVQYEVATGLRVRSVQFINVKDRVIAKPLVYNP